MLIDYSAYIPAIALAGAAEEILGSFVGKQAAFHQLKIKISDDHNVSGKIVANGHLNKLKNWIKHCSEGQDNTYLEYCKQELEDTTIQYILRGVTNLTIHDRTVPSELPRFQQWIADNRPDLDL